MMSDAVPARFVPDRPFPSYAYVPGRHPHPGGKELGHVSEPISGLEEETLSAFPPFLFGADLFNHGYYWEAHEVWEELWRAAGRTGRLADLLKGLIKLAAAGVKARQGNRDGVLKHADRARELFGETGYRRLAEFAQHLKERPVVDTTFTTQGHPVLPTRLRPEDFSRD